MSTNVTYGVCVCIPLRCAYGRNRFSLFSMRQFRFCQQFSATHLNTLRSLRIWQRPAVCFIWNQFISNRSKHLRIIELVQFIFGWTENETNGNVLAWWNAPLETQHVAFRMPKLLHASSVFYRNFNICDLVSNAIAQNNISLYIMSPWGNLMSRACI